MKLLPFGTSSAAKPNEPTSTVAGSRNSSPSQQTTATAIDNTPVVLNPSSANYRNNNSHLEDPTPIIRRNSMDDYEDDTVMPPDMGRQKRLQDEAFQDDEDVMQMQSTNIRCVKWTVLWVLILSGAAVTTTAYLSTARQEESRFQEAFDDDATRFLQAFYQQQANKLWVLVTLAVNYKSLQQQLFPDVTLPNFEAQTLGSWRTSDAASLFYAPALYSQEQQTSWEAYAVEHQVDAGIYNDDFDARAIDEGIFRLDENYFPVTDDSFFTSPTNDVKVPLWQINPSAEKRHLNMFNLNTLSNGVVDLLRTTKVPQFTPIMEQEMADFFLRGDDQADAVAGPRSLIMFPILDDTTGEMLAISGAEVDWITYFNDVLLEGHKTDIVLTSTCSPSHTYQVTGTVATYRGEGDLHDSKYSSKAQTTTLEELSESANWDDFPAPSDLSDSSYAEGCFYGITVYPTQEYESIYVTSWPIAYTLAAAALTLVAVSLFAIYVYLADRRQRQVLDSAAKSNAIIKSLFPAVVRDRLFGGVMGSTHSRNTGSHGGGGGVGRRRLGNTSQNVSLNTDDNHLTNPKIRLTNFLTSSFPNEMESLTQREDEPIAEMFSNTTVMFADIAGFTAWSSEREPAQVFKLLETLYHEFDTIAKRLNVFKVETIGDCYVAVTGLPEPTKHHAKIMARFAYEILLSTNQLTQQLQGVLGPGTMDLGLRIGLHSGPVTAGVLRGAKSRFQLFGDTMNTSARMESTGEVGKIHVSQVTADLISKAGKHYWLTQRDGTVTAKGKGEMQTHWLMIRRASNRSLVIPQDNPDCEEAEDEIDFDQPVIASPQTVQKRDSRLWGHMAADAESITSRYSFSVKEDRLIDWNVEVLMGFLEKVVHHRLVTKTSRWGATGGSFGNAGSANEVDNTGLIIDEVAEIITLPKFNSRYSSQNATTSKLLPLEIRLQMKEFVASIASLYRDVPFHNFEHASHVTMSANKLMKRIILPDDSSKKGSNYESDLHISTFGISSDPLTQFAVVFAALIHDVDHTGLSNAQLVKERAAIARIFNNKSVAEQNSVVVAWELLMEPRYEDLQQCIFAHGTGQKRFRQLVVNAVMATDIMDKDMVSLRKKRWEKAFDPSLGNEVFLLDIDVNRKATIVIEHIIQASDVAHTMQHWHIFIKWNTRLYRELYRAYTNGHSDQDPSEGWYEDQISFLDNYVIPLAKKLRECGVFGVSGDEYLTYAQLNRSEWERKGREETRKMIRQYRGTIARGTSNKSMDGTVSGLSSTGMSSASTELSRGVILPTSSNGAGYAPEMSAGIRRIETHHGPHSGMFS